MPPITDNIDVFVKKLFGSEALASQIYPNIY